MSFFKKYLLSLLITLIGGYLLCSFVLWDFSCWNNIDKWEPEIRFSFITMEAMFSFAVYVAINASNIFK